MGRRHIARRRADHIAGADRGGLLAKTIVSLTRQDEEHFLVDVMGMARKRLLARWHDMQLAAKLARANHRPDAAELGDELSAIAVGAQRRVGDVDDGPHHPTLPSRLIAISFCASTANSIGNCCSTSRTKPLTISAVASSPDRPRCRQ